MVIARQQTLVQLTDELVEALDERAARERRSRSQLIREAIERFLADDLRAREGAAIVDGYRRMPPESAMDELAEWSLRSSIAEEPW